MNRRVFLSRVATAGAAVGLSPAAALAAPAIAPSAPSHAVGSAGLNGLDAAAPATSAPALNRAFFERLHGTLFTVHGDASRRLELVELRDGPEAPGLEQFAAVFRDAAPVSRALPSGLITLGYSGQELRIYLELIGDDAQGACYGASVCLLKP